jgi:hypothetical protein
MLDYSLTSNILLFGLLAITFILYIRLWLTSPGYLEANLVELDNLESAPRNDSWPRITNFSQKMSDNLDEKPAKVRPIKVHLKGKKYQEFEDEFDRSPGLDGIKTEWAEDSSPSDSKIHRYAKGHTKIIKSQTTQQMTDILNESGERKRNKVFETIHGRIRNSTLGFEPESGHQMGDDEINAQDFISRIDQNKDELLEASDCFEDRSKLKIKNTLLYGDEVPKDKLRKISVVDEFDDDRCTEKEEKVTEKIHHFDYFRQNKHSRKDTSPKYNFNVDLEEYEIETLDNDEEEKHDVNKENSTTQNQHERLDNAKELNLALSL